MSEMKIVILLEWYSKKGRQRIVGKEEITSISEIELAKEMGLPKNEFRQTGKYDIDGSKPGVKRRSKERQSLLNHR